MSDLAAFQDQFSEALHHSGDLIGHGDARSCGLVSAFIVIRFTGP